MRTVSLYMPIFTIWLMLSACAQNPAPYKKNATIMGTVITQTIYESETKAAPAALEAETRLRELEKLLSFQNPESELNKLNKAAGGGWVTLSNETIFNLNEAIRYSIATDGSFNILVGPLVKRWKVTAPDADIPPHREILALLSLIDWHDLKVDILRGRARLLKKGQMADLGGIAKGYASDEVIAVYKKKGITKAIIDIGGNIGLLGSAPDGKPWRIGIQDPKSARGVYVGYVTLENKSLSTSGAYERYFEKNGKRYHHIIDPKTGYPADAGIISASIIADTSIQSDALSKIFVMGIDKGIAAVKKFPGAGAVLITNDRRVVISSELKEIYTHKEESGYRLEIR